MAEQTEQTTSTSENVAENVAEKAVEKPAPPAIRSAEEILRDARIAEPIAKAGDAIVDAREFAGEITVTIAREKIRETAQLFKDAGFKYLVDLAGVDYSTYPGHTGERFAVSYHIYSHEKNDRIRLKTWCDDGATVPSVTSVWKTANWHERETFDMFGIVFEGHPNLERILMWEGFNGHPLRKDFPLRGIDTGARIYPEVFPEGGGPKPGSTGKDVKDVNVFQGEWPEYGRAPVVQTHAKTQQPPTPELATEVAETAKPTEEAPFHDPNMPLAQRMDLAKEGDLKAKLFAAMAQTDCTACGWDCEGYAEALASGETQDITLCVPGEEETESMLSKLMAEAGKL
ncbi:MAG TPA: NADH-quinone oxidoreductase subunit C [Thermoanaerobaculia bacterium]|nr:NADH-quinone oxidoreductase subunit C [Thermoanaerobaculia bacterium]